MGGENTRPQFLRGVEAGCFGYTREKDKEREPLQTPSLVQVEGMGEAEQPEGEGLTGSQLVVYKAASG